MKVKTGPLGRLAGGMAALVLAACASNSGPPPGTVLDAIQREVASAARVPPVAAKPTGVEHALLPPLQLEVPAKPLAKFDIAVQNAPAGQVFNGIVHGTPFSVALPPDLQGSVTFNLKAVSLKDVLDTLRDVYGYDYVVRGDRILISSNGMQTRIFKINYLAGSRSGESNVRVVGNSLSSPAGQATGASSGVANSPSVSRTTGGSSVSGGGDASATIRSTTSQQTFWEELRATLEAIVRTGASVNGSPGAQVQGGGASDSPAVIVSPASGMIVARANPRELKLIEQYLESMQATLERQVMLEAKIVQVSLSEETQAGVNWAAFRTRGTSNLAFGIQGSDTSIGATGAVSPLSTLPTMTGASLGGATTGASSTPTTVVPGSLIGALTTGASGGFYGLAFQSANFAALLSFLESQGSVQVLSSPRIATLNNQKAILKVGTEGRYVFDMQVTQAIGATTSTITPTIQFQTLFGGIALDVTPQIDDHDQIILHVHPSISRVTEEKKIIDVGGQGRPLELPLATVRVDESDSVVKVRDGSIVAIGGLMRVAQAGESANLPGTKESGLGWLFGQKSSGYGKTELVILIKPTIIRDEGDWRGSADEAANRLKEFAPPAPVRIVNP